MAAFPSCIECATIAGYHCRACGIAICDAECGSLHARRAHPRDYRALQAARTRRHWRDPEIRRRTTEAIRAAWRARGGLTSEERAQRAARFSALWRDPAFRERMREAMRRSWRERGGHHPEERRAVFVERARARWMRPDYRERVVAARRRRG